MREDAVMLLRNYPNRTVRRAAFTLMEMLVVVAIIVAIAGIGGYFLFAQLGQTEKDAARLQIKGPLTDAVKTYYLRNNKQYPDNLQILLDPSVKGGPYLEEVSALVDPWGQEYKYDKGGQKNGGRRPDIWTIAPDGEEIGN